MKPVSAGDEFLSLWGWRLRNRSLCVLLATAQLFVTATALAQHLHSVLRYSQVLHCNFNESASDPLLAADVIIFDVGLFHVLWGIDRCIANYMDGGYLRAAWCLGHTAVLVQLICLCTWTRFRPTPPLRPFLLWPVLTQSSIYGIGLLILSLSALPKLLPTFLDADSEYSELALPALVYCAGAGLNFAFLYILWHFYWHTEAVYAAAEHVQGAGNEDVMSTLRNNSVTDQDVPETVFTTV